MQYAKDMGVGDVPSVPSLALGSGEVTLDTMTAAYAAFANHGLVPKPLLIRRVEDRDGRVLYEAAETSTRAISESTAFLMSTMMADVINAGTAAGARGLGFKLPAAGKTGTTNDFNDAWFVGYTPRLVAGVWVGFDQPKTILPNGFAAQIAVPLWTTFMKAATRDDKPEWFTPPAGVTTATVCRLSGKLASEGCDDTYLEYLRGRNGTGRVLRPSSHARAAGTAGRTVFQRQQAESAPGRGRRQSACRDPDQRSRASRPDRSDAAEAGEKTRFLVAAPRALEAVGGRHHEFFARQHRQVHLKLLANHGAAPEGARGRRLGRRGGAAEFALFARVQAGPDEVSMRAAGHDLVFPADVELSGIVGEIRRVEDSHDVNGHLELRRRGVYPRRT